MRSNQYKSIARLLFLLVASFASFLSEAQVVRTESFEGTQFLPTGWGASPAGSSTSSWTRVTNGSQFATFPTVTAHTGTAVARFNTRTTTAGTRQTISTPLFDLSGIGAGTAYVSLWIYRYDTLQYDSLNIMINTVRDTNGAVNLGSIAVSRQVALPDSQTVAGWYQYSFPVPASFNGDTNYVMIRGINATGSASGYRIFIDDVSWDTYPGACTGAPAIGTASTTTPVLCGGSGTATLNLSGTSVSTGISYIWQSSTDSLGPWLPNGATGITTTSPTITSSTWFRCLAICTNTLDTAASNAVQVVVDAAALPVVSVTPASAVRCSNDNTPILLTASGASGYSWRTSTSGNVLGQTDTISVLPNNSTTYIVTGYNSALCLDTQSVRVTVSTPPTITGVTRSDTAVCPGDSVTLTANIFGFGTGYVYTWTPGGYTGRIVTVAVTAATTFTVSATNNGCSGTASTGTASVGVLPAAVAGTVTSSDTIICGGSGTAQLTMTGANGAAYLWYTSPTGVAGSWTSSGIAATSFTDSVSSPTYYICVATCGADSAASNTQFVNVSSGPLPVVAVTPDFNAYCLNSNDTVPVFVASGASTYTWSNANNLTISLAGDTATPTVTNGGGYTFIVTGYDAAGCFSTDTATYRIAGTPAVTVTPSNISLCVGDSVTLNVTQTGTSFTVTYAWSNGATGNSLSLPVITNDTLYVTGTSSWGCSSTQSTDTAFITAISAPVAGSIITADTVICGGSGITQLSLNGASGGNYTWYSGSSASGPWTLTTDQGVAINSDTLTSGTYFICVSACPSNPLASDTTDVPAFVNVSTSPLPVVSTNVPQVFYCNNTPPAEVTATGGLYYEWSPTTGITGSANDSVLSVIVAQSTYYTVTGYDAAGCSDTGVVWVRFRNNPEVSVTPGSTAICDGDSLTLTANVTNNIGNGGTMSYTWQPGGLTGNSITVAPTANETYIVTGISSFGCSDTGSVDTVAVTVDPLAIASFTYVLSANDLTVNNTSADYTSYSIDYGDNTGPTVSLIHNYQSVGQYTVTLTAQSPCNTDTETVVIDVLSIGMEEADVVRIAVFPNPANDRLKVDFNGSVASVEIRDVLGNKLVSRRVSAADRQSVMLDLSGLASGVYFARVADVRGGTATVRFIKQ